MPDNLQYSLINNNGNENITVFYGGQMYAATSAHSNWNAIKAGALTGDTSVVDLFDIGKVAQTRFERLSDRVTINAGVIYFDNQPTHNALTSQVLRFIEAGQQDFQPLVNFFEKVQSNPNEHSREQLYSWLDIHDFTILPNGNFIGYKGVKMTRETLPDSTSYTEKYFSISRGTAISDGVQYTGAIPNPLGAIVEMPRDQVEHDPAVGCHVGLHVGTWDYASGFAQGAVLKVEVNPRDVVSVPTDCGWQKLRTCRYTVLEVIDAPVDGPLDTDGVEDDIEDDESAVVVGYNFDIPKTVVQTMAGSVDTRLNHLRQKRDANGRFIPKK